MCVANLGSTQKVIEENVDNEFIETAIQLLHDSKFAKEIDIHKVQLYHELILVPVELILSTIKWIRA